MSKKLKAVLADCRVLQIPFVDVDFPPVASSLGALSGAGAAAAAAPIPTVRWLRPFSARPLAPPPPSSSSKAVELLPRLGEVVSGTLFGTGLSPLAQALRLLARVAPQRIRALFRNHVPNADGAVCVTLHEAGGGGSVRKRERNVVVDDLLPCDPRSEQPLCTATAGLDSVWPCVVEKALAKMHGSFAAAHTLSLAVVLEELCGAPATTEKLQQLHAMTPSESAELWATLSEAVARKRVVCVSTRVNSTAADEPLLLLDGAATAATAASGETRLLRLRGDTVRNTAWGPNSPNWTPELRAKLGVAQQQQQPDQQAESWVALEEFIGMIDSVTVVHGDTEWRYTTLPMRLVRPQSLVAIDIPMADGADVLFSIRQQTTAKTTPILGTRFCVVQKERPHKPFGGTNEAFVASVLHTTDRLHLPHGSFLGMLEVYRQHEAHLPATVELVVATTAKKPLSPKAVEYEGGKPPEWAFVLPEFSRKNGQCAACGNALAGTIFTVQSAKFHDFCFVCTDCGTALGTAILVRDGKLYCQACGSNPKQKKK